MTRLPIATGLLLLFTCAPSFAANFTLEKAHTQAEFVVKHMFVSKLHGQITLATGSATIAENGLPSAINATFDLATFGTGNGTRDADLRDHYLPPTIAFIEKSVKGNPKAFTITGNLTIHGVTKSVNIATTLDATAVVKGKKHYAYSATTTIDRRDYGMTFGPLLDSSFITGDEVKINFEADAQEN